MTSQLKTRSWNWILGSLALVLVFTTPAAAEMKVSYTDAIRAAVKKVQPDYNPMAKQLKVQGDVELEAKINEKGDVEEVKILSGNAMLSASAVKALKEWKFTPFQDGGKPSAASAIIKFSFKL